ncbi:NIPSNAP family protein [Flavobacterium aestivum]|uniref:NIPSNAP family protein n=1 Tax=Flavobacterium aestivum TaxID=3003257 RepID=UPI002286B77B|nr:NIPSNAP family protein [Flavobacterium aestivum]
MVTEIRTYKLKKGLSEDFQKIFIEVGLPMLKRWKVNVVDYGLSLVDNESFYVIRGYDSVEQRKKSQEEFYGSDEWINGPNDSVMNCIETYNTVVIENEKLSITRLSSDLE